MRLTVPSPSNGMRVHARAGGPLLALDRELWLVGVVAEQLELLEARLQPELAKRGRDRIRGLSRSVAPGGARADVGREGVDEVHVGESTTTDRRANARQ